MADVSCLCYCLLSSITTMLLNQTMFAICNMAVALYMPTLNLVMHPCASRGQHNHSLLGRFCFSLLVTATMADVSPTHHTVRVTF
jgi:hypothetical protein